MLLRRSTLLTLCLAAAPTLIACGGDDNRTAGTTARDTGPAEPQRRQVVREQCQGQAQQVDVNNDGRPDIRHVMQGARKRCSAYDMNYDGMADVTRFYESDGETPRLEQHDFDFDGRLDRVAYFENGRMVRQEVDTNFDDNVDTWFWCAEGRVARAEKDRRNNGTIDAWETYEEGLLVEASYDEDNDGRADKWEIFEGGRLVEVRFDTDSDGEVDRTEAIATTELGPADSVVFCDEEPTAGAGGESS